MRSSQGGRKYAETSLLRCRCLSPAKAKEPLPTIATSIWRENEHQFESVFQQALTRISEHQPASTARAFAHSVGEPYFHRVIFKSENCSWVLLSLSEREGYSNLGYGNFILLKWRKQWNRIGANTIFVKARARTGFTRSRVSHLRPYCLERSRNFVYILRIPDEARRVESAEESRCSTNI